MSAFWDTLGGMAIAYHADIVLNHKSGIVADADHIGLYFATGTDATATDFDNMKTHIAAFFNTTPTGAGASLGSYLSNALAVTTDAMAMRFYKMPAVPGQLGSPVATRTWTLSTTGAQGMPNEMAACLSYQKTYGTDVEFGAGGLRPRSSDRGRVYLGPLSGSEISQDTTTKEVRIGSTGLPQVAVKAAHQFLGTAMTADSITWVQFSRKRWTFDAVTKCWMDNAYDIQRRRGVLPTVTYSETF